MEPFVNEQESQGKQSKHGSTETQAVFMSLYQAYSVPLYRYIFSRLRDRDQTEDIVQKTFLKVYQVFLRSDSEQRKRLTGAYCFAAARNALTDYFRKKKDISFDTSDPHWQNIADSGETPVARSERIGDRAELMMELASLPMNEKEVLRLKFFGDLSTIDIARILETSVDNVRQLQCRGLKHLRKKVTHI